MSRNEATEKLLKNSIDIVIICQGSSCFSECLLISVCSYFVISILSFLCRCANVRLQSTSCHVEPALSIFEWTVKYYLSIDDNIANTPGGTTRRISVVALTLPHSSDGRDWRCQEATARQLGSSFVARLAIRLLLSPRCVDSRLRLRPE